MSERSALRLLGIYRHYHVQAGEPLLLGKVSGAWFDQNGKSDDLFRGMEYALQNKWIEFKDERYYVLTASGFARMQE